MFIRIATIVGMLSVVVAGVAVSRARASTDSATMVDLGFQDYSCSGLDDTPITRNLFLFTGTIRAHFVEEGPQQGLRVTLSYMIKQANWLPVHGNLANATFTDEGAENGPLHVDSGEGARQDGEFYRIGNSYVRRSTGGRFKFSFHPDVRFMPDRELPGLPGPDTGVHVPASCAVDLADIRPPGRSAPLPQDLRYTCTSDDFSGTIQPTLRHETIARSDQRSPVQPRTTNVEAVEYSIDRGRWRGGNHADVTFQDHAAVGAPASFHTGAAMQDGTLRPIPLSEPYARMAGKGPVEALFVFDKRHRPDPQCRMVLPSLP